MRLDLFFRMPQDFSAPLTITLLIGVLSSFGFVGCGPSTLSIVPDESIYVLQSEDVSESVIGDFRERANELNQGSAVYSATLKTPLYSRTFEQGIVFSENSFRASIYAANFARLLFYVVINGDTSLTCDVEAKEAIYSDSGVMCLPDLPRQLANPQLLLDILLGRFAWKAQNPASLSIFRSAHGTNNDKMLLRLKNQNEEIEGLYLNQLEDIRLNKFVIPERVILRTRAGTDQENIFCAAEVSADDEILIEYSYFGKGTFSQPILPNTVKVHMPSRDIVLEYQTIKFSAEIQGSTEQLFNTQPPASYRILRVK